MKKKRVLPALAALMLLLSGCAAPPRADQGPTAEPISTETPIPAPQGELAQAVQALLQPYESELAIVHRLAPGEIACTIPGDVLMQMARDAQQVGAAPREGRYQFTWRQAGEHTYQATAQDAYDELEIAENATPDPQDEAPMDSQLMGDYAVTGGGLFDRERTYDAAADLSRGRAEITDTLNEERTGHEVFSFAMRGKDLYFVDAAMDRAVGIDGLEDQSHYLVAAGILRQDGVEIVEYFVPALEQLPDPETLDWPSLLAAVTPVSRLSVIGETVNQFN